MSNIVAECYTAADLWKMLHAEKDKREAAEARVTELVGTLEEVERRLVKAYETMNLFASGETMKAYRRIEPSDILIEVYQELAPLVQSVSEALAKAKG